MRNTAGTKKDFVELTFISALFLGISLFSACASMVKEAKSAEPSTAYAASGPAPSAEFILTKGGRSGTHN